ncbi:MAG: iron-containing redox enzyme family protein [Chloroflexota bacterium]
MMQSAAIQDFGFTPSEMNGQEIVEFLDRRIGRLLQEIEVSEVWQIVTNPDSNPELVQEVMKEIYLEVVMYQPDVIEATIATIAQMPRTMPVELFDEMLHHQVEEFDHGEMALRDYMALGGDEVFARNRRMSPTAFSVAAMWRMLCHMRDPFAYLGALYPFEGLTPIISEKIKSILRTKGMGDDSLEFVDYHSTADLEHTRIVKELIAKIADDYPESRESICYGIEYFLAVYPLPGWSAGLARARSRLTMAVV